jgi:hypothetical protein
LFGHDLIEPDTDDPTRIITWQQHFYQYKCPLHENIGRSEFGVAPTCYQCEALPEEKRASKQSYKSELQRSLMRKPIGIFMRDYYLPFIRDKYRQHWWLMQALGKRYCLEMREGVIERENDSVAFHRDYTDRLSMEYNDAAMLTGMGGGNFNSWNGRVSL